ncbi:MAG: glutamate racemase [Candidatus Stahlbacteria bacterium]|nr:MAG: glutamate racemase [Candidatus Stahlbacteria bacterium]
MPEHIYKNSPIGVFDSGIGGLTVVNEIRKKLPNESIVYFGDTARVPYGTKSTDTIIRFAREDIEFLLEQNVKIVVSACFSVSSNALPYLSSAFDIPIIGMISPGVEAVRKKSYKKIGVIGTQATIESGAFYRELKRAFKGIQIHSTTCPLFVPLAEEGWTSGEVPFIVAKKYLSSLLNEDIEALILGCTHYPLLYPVIKKVMGEDVDIIEPGKEVTLIIKRFLKDNEIESSDDGNLKIFLSDIPRNFPLVVENFLKHPVEEVHLVRSE